jgi:hypothetical protein
LEPFYVVVHQSGAVYLDDALDARPTTVVGGKVMQRGGPDTAGTVLSQSLKHVYHVDPQLLAAYI